MRVPRRDRPVVLTVAGSDCSGEAGIQADIKTLEAYGADAAAVVTAVTAQTSRSMLDSSAVSEELVRRQLDAVFEEMDVAAVKSGMLANGATVGQLARALRRHAVTAYVCDPVLASSSGGGLLEADAVSRLRDELFPLAALVTPNVAEARILSGIEIASASQAERAARLLLQTGAAAVLIKGGHRVDRPAADLLVTARGSIEIPGTWIDSDRTRGTGCRLAAAIAAGLARGQDLLGAVTGAKAFVGATLGRGAIGVLHVILDETRQTRYRHVDLARLAATGGADVIQYRDKRPLRTAERVATARRVREALGAYPARLVVNDRADVALACGSAGVHLGPGDLEPATARRILGSPALIGATANDLAAARRLAAQPVDYLGVGPVFGTSSKDDPAPALGLEGLARIAAAVSRPVVAIGNITPDRVASVLSAGAAGIAVLSGVVCDDDPCEATRRFRLEIDRAMRGKARSSHVSSASGS